MNLNYLGVRHRAVPGHHCAIALLQRSHTCETRVTSERWVRYKKAESHCELWGRGKKNREEALFLGLQFQFQQNLFYSEVPAAPHPSSHLLDSWLNPLSLHQRGVFGNYPYLENPAVCFSYCILSLISRKMRRASWLIGGHLKSLPWEITKRILTFLNLSKLWDIF